MEAVTDPTTVRSGCVSAVHPTGAGDRPCPHRWHRRSDSSVPYRCRPQLAIERRFTGVGPRANPSSDLGHWSGRAFMNTRQYRLWGHLDTSVSTSTHSRSWPWRTSCSRTGSGSSSSRPCWPCTSAATGTEDTAGGADARTVAAETRRGRIGHTFHTGRTRLATPSTPTTGRRASARTHAPSRTPVGTTDRPHGPAHRRPLASQEPRPCVRSSSRSSASTSRRMA